jgi:hypothetical protein
MDSGASHRSLYVVFEADAVSAAIELPRRFPGITNSAKAPDHTR